MVPFVALILRGVSIPKPQFWHPGSHFGTLGLHFGGLGSPRDSKGSPKRKRVDSGSYSPLIWTPILTRFWTKLIKNGFWKRFVSDLWPTLLFFRFVLKNGRLGIPECDEHIVNTISDAMSPCADKSSKHDGPELHFEWLWHHFGITLATKWHPEAVFWEVVFLRGKTC